MAAHKVQGGTAVTRRLGLALAVLAAAPGSIDLATMTGEGNRILGASNDGLGSSIAALGDVNGDGYDDFAIGGNGAYVVYGGDLSSIPTLDLSQPLSQQPLAIYHVAPATTDVGAAVVAAAGDLNGDSIGDLLIGFPDASAPLPGQGSAYVVYGQGTFQTPSNVDLSTMGGERGTRFLGGAAGDHLGAALGGTDAASADEPGMMLGVPGADGSLRPDAGSAYVVRSSSLAGGYSAATASSSSSSSHPCAKRGSAPTTANPAGTAPYHFTRPRDLAHCRRSDKNVADVMPHGKAASARTPVGQMAVNNTYGSKKWPLLDSYGTVIGYVEQLHKHQFRVRTAADVVYATTPNSVATLKIQGRACMSPDNLSDSYALVYLERAGSASFRAFVNRNALVGGFKGGGTRSGVDSRVDAHAVGSGTGSHYSNNRTAPTTASITKPTFSGGTDRYQGPTEETTCPKGKTPISIYDPNCGFLYEPYSRPSFSASTMMLSRATTGVSAGGIENAVIVSTSAFRELDHIRYVDHNVPCSRELVARWYFGDANPNAPYVSHRDSSWRTKAQHIYGWYPQKVSTGVHRTAQEEPTDGAHC